MSTNDPQPPDEAVPTKGSKQETEYDAERSQIGADLAEDGIEEARREESVEPGLIPIPQDVAQSEAEVEEPTDEAA